MARGAQPLCDEVKVLLQSSVVQIFLIGIPTYIHVGMISDVHDRFDGRQVATLTVNLKSHLLSKAFAVSTQLI
jgi:hypothetical protein